MSVVRRHRTAVLVAVALLVVLVAGAVLGRDDAAHDGPLDPRNPKDAGAQAVARVLDDRGVSVQVARGQAAFLDATVDAGTTVVVTNPDRLGPSTFDRMRSRGAGDVVVVGAAGVALDRLGLEAREGGRGDAPAACDDALFTGLTVHVRAATSIGGAGCFRSGDGVLLTRTDSGVWLLSAGDLLSNDHVLEADNAAVALRLLGQHSRLVWYVADAADVPVGDAVTVGSLLPRWLLPALWVVALATVALVLWRGRRFGPLVREPLPVAVRASETTESRGRLYHRARDRDHAAAVLTAATRDRLGRLLALPAGTDLDGVVAAAAARSGRDAAEVGSLLTRVRVADDRALAELGRDLLRLEDEVR